jgi:hypothetical protein
MHERSICPNGKEYDLIILLTNKNRAKMRTKQGINDLIKGIMLEGRVNVTNFESTANHIIEALTKENNLIIPNVIHWEAIEEALPEISEWVLCCNTEDDWTDFAEIKHNGEGKIVFYNRECEIYPTHWRELPKPPCL